MGTVPAGSDEAAELCARISRLEAELAEARAALRALDDAAGHDTDQDPRLPTPPPVEHDGDLQHADVTATSPAHEKIALFRQRFAGREDVYAHRWTSRRTGKSGWGPTVRGGYVKDLTPADFLPLDDSVIERHLRVSSPSDGRPLHAGLYPMLDDDRCRLLVCDFDDGDWRGDAAAYVGEFRRAGIDALAEISRSGEGAHVWVFFAAPVPAATARSAGMALLRSAMSRRPRMDFRSYDRFFPSQDSLPQRSSQRARLGNLIALPLEGDCRRRGTTVFADPETWLPHDDQFAALARTIPVAETRLEDLATASTRARIGPAEALEPRPGRATIRAGAKAVAGHRIELRRAAMVHIPLEGLPGSVITELKHMASLANPEFYRKQAQRFSTFGTPRLVTCFEHDEMELRLPRGLLDESIRLLESAGFRVSERARPASVTAVDVDFTGELRPEQRTAATALLAHDAGVLVAPPGSGKTVIACALIAERQVPTAILLNRAELLAQWRTELARFLSLSEKQIGQLGSGRRKRRGIVDLIMMQSVSHRDADPSVLEEYGQIIVDECHAVAAPATEAALRGIDVSRWVGLTATPFRADRMDGLITMQCGPIRHTIESAVAVEKRFVVHDTEFTTDEPGTEGPSIQAIYGELAQDEDRNALIVQRIVEATDHGRASLVLTNRLDHLEVLAREIRSRTDIPVFRLHGRLSPAERRDVREDLRAADADDRSFVLVAIDKVAGEGLDLPTLNTLFLAVPVSFKGRVIQQIGRITRGGRSDAHPAVVHDFRDRNVPILERMHRRRRRVMAKEGFSAAESPQPH